MRFALLLLCLVLLAPIACSEETPAPTPTVTPTVLCPSPADQTYFDNMGEITSALAGTHTTFRAMFAEVGESPILLFDNDWQTEVDTQLTLLSVYPDRIRLIPGTESTGDIHDVMGQIADALDNIVAFTTSALDDRDRDALEQAKAEENHMTALTMLAANMVDSFCP